MNRPFPLRLPSAFGLFSKLLGLRERLAALFRGARPEPRTAKLAFEAMEERVVPDSRPLPGPMIFAGGAGTVRAYDAGTGALKWSATPFGASATVAVRVAAGDITGDGIPDAIVTRGSGEARVEVLDGRTGAVIGAPLGNFLAYPTAPEGGVFVAAADVNGDGRQDIITAAKTDAGPRVKVFGGTDGTLLANFLVTGSAFADGVTIGAADFTGDGKAEVVVGGSAGGWVRTYNPLTGATISGPLGSFRAFGSGYDDAVFVGTDDRAGDVTGDSRADLVVGTGSGEVARVKVFNGVSGAVVYDFRPFGTGFEGGARVALAYADNDSRADIVVGSGPGTAAQVKVYSGATGAQLAAPLGSYSPFGAATTGVYVGASNDPVYPTSSWDEVSTSLVEGQRVRAIVRFTGTPGSPGFPPMIPPIPPLAPTGTVTFTTTGTGAYVLGTATLVPDANGYEATAALIYWAPPAGVYTLVATYSGDANFNSTTALQPFSVSASPVPAVPGGVGYDPVATPAGAGVARAGFNADGVKDQTGSVTCATCTILASDALGSAWVLAPTWTSAAGYADGVSGSGGTTFVRLAQLNGNDSVALVSDASTAYFFDLYGGGYHARYGAPVAFAHDTVNGRFVATDGTGRVLTFYDFSAGTPTGRGGQLISVTEPGGQVTAVTSWSGSGNPTEVQRTTGSGGSALTDSFVYAYISSGTNAGLLDTVTHRTQVGGGSWSTVRSVALGYYDGTTGPGLAGNLKFATVKDAAGAAIDTNYYRYYTSGTGSSGNLKYSFGAASYDRLVGALGGSVDALTDAQVAPYADRYAVYDGSGRATTVVVSGSGCSVCSAGLGTFTYAYTANAAAGLPDPNAWVTKTVETQPNGTTNTIYTNAIGEVMLVATADGTGNVWRSYTEYDGDGRPVLMAGPTTVTGYNDAYADLVHFSSGNASYLSDSAGVVTVYTYATTTTATGSAAGDAAGFLAEVGIKQGETGTVIPQETVTFIKNTVGGVDLFHVAAQTAYRNDNGTGAQTTSFAYTFASGTNQVASVTTTLPTVTTAQNGSNSATTATTVADAFGRIAWTKDQGGFINYVAYDDLTGAVTKTIVDVDTTQTGTFANLPSGWSTPSGGGLHLTTTYEVDALGRVTKMTAPNGRVDYTVYNDAGHEVRSYVGWNTSTNTPTGPTVVTREDRANGYTETLTMSAAPSVSSGRPTGAESVAQVQSLSRSYRNEAGQTVQTDAYFDLTGLAYSNSTTLGTEGVHFYRTRYQYDDTGAVKRVQTPQGTITRTVRDGMARVVSEWVGTDDTPTTGYWSPTNLTGTNLVKVAEYEYDGGGVGDGNLTKVTEHPGGGAADRVTQTWFDWRDRSVAVKSGVETSESTSVNRPLVYTDYDNLGAVIETRVYDADGVTPTVTSGVPQPLSSGLLRAQAATSFDELGREYRSDTYSVDPSSGSVGSYTLYSLTWYDSRGNVEKTQAPGGLVQKMSYDGAGRVTVSYTTDGGGDSGYADAATVTGDTVLTQTEPTYDASGNVLATLTRERFHDATGTGALGNPSSGVAARVSYAGFYYDLADRLTASVDVGTSGGSAWTRPGSVPTGSATVLVTATRYATDAVQDIALTGSPTGGTFTLSFGGYTTGAIAYNASAATVQTALAGLTSIGSGNVAVTAAPGGSGWEVRFTGSLVASYQAAVTASGAGLTGGTSPAVAVAAVNAGGDAGMAAEMTDPAGRVSRTYADALGRTVRTVQNFVDGVVSVGDDKTVGYTFNGAGMTSLTAYLTGGGVQVTAYLYGVTQAGGSGIDSGDVAEATLWPDPTLGTSSSSQREDTTVNALGQVVTMTDRNGSVHTLSYDVLGRVVSDAVTTLGSGVDGAVRRIETAYDGQGNAYLVTSYSAASGGSIVNQVQRAFNGLGQLITEWQAHGGSVNTSTSPKVQYAYSEMPSGADHSRLTSITYPDGYVLTYNYASGLDSSISRLSSLSDSTGTLEAYSYLGIGTVVVRAHPQPNVDLSYAKRSGESVGDAGDQYTGLDRFGRVADQRWLNPSTGTATDRFQYGYDQAGNRLYRDNLVNTAFGEVYTYDGLDQLASFARGTLNGTKTGLTGGASRTQSWAADAVGNFTGVTTNGATQTRTANAQNEITGIGGATTPTYDANGNMTGDETGRQFVYDAWNRLVAVKNSGGTTLETFGYDGMGRRVSQTASGTTADLYYSADWQVLTEKVGSATTKRYVWSPVYVDALILRDRDTNADGTITLGTDERLWVQQDANWNVTALVDGNGAVVERYAYDPYGVQNVCNVSWSSIGGSNYAWAQGFQGMFFDVVSGLDLSRWRPGYSATLGRWVTVDPERFGAGDVNFYRFVGNYPVNAVDPTGLREVRVWLTFDGDWITNGAGDWHSTYATVNTFIPGPRTQMHERGKTLKEVVDAIKKRLSDKDCISYLQFNSHGKGGEWVLLPNVKRTGKRDDKKSDLAPVLTLDDLRTYVAAKRGAPTAHLSAAQKEMIEAIDYLRSKMCDKSDVVLKICNQANGPGGQEFCSLFSLSLNKFVYGKDGCVGLKEPGDWWLFPPGGEKQKVDCPPQ